MRAFMLFLSIFLILGDQGAIAGLCVREPCELVKEERFNVVCNFRAHDQVSRLEFNSEAPRVVPSETERNVAHNRMFKQCRVVTTFYKHVTVDGAEMNDESDLINNPWLEVRCDGLTVFNDRARRFTALLGTRIQGESGHFPCLQLPRGTLHSGSNGTSGAHVAQAFFEVDVGNFFFHGKGKCQIWTEQR
jgi:hypothetical protein